MRIRISHLAAVAFAGLAACAAPTTRQTAVSEQATDAEAIRQSELAVEDLTAKWRRVERIYRTIAVRARTVCGEDVGPDAGILVLTRPKGHLGDALARLYGIGEKPTILHVVEGAPAEAAGLRAGDVVRRVNGETVNDMKSLRELEYKLPRGQAVSYEVERSGVTMTVPVQADEACRYRAFLSGSQVVNALADGKSLWVTRGMVNFAGKDQELALVIAHEMAHNVMRHIDKRKQNAGAGVLADLLVALATRGQVSGSGFQQAGAMAFSKEFEAEADYVGLYLLANAGFPIDDAPLFWRRMAAEHPASIKANHAASHPSTAYRMVALENAVREIRAKQAAGEPLTPNMKDGEVSPATEAGR